MRFLPYPASVLLCVLATAGGGALAAQTTSQQGWLPTFGPPPGTGSGKMLATAVFDDGSGPALYVGGDFEIAAGKPALHVARWDGVAWSPLSAGLDGSVQALAVFDDGSGPALYAGGAFATSGGTAVANIARWDGASWSQVGVGVGGGVVGGGVGGKVAALAVFDDGNGPALYAGGAFTTAGGAPASRVARWDGASWSPLGLGVNDTVSCLAVFDEGTGPVLYAGGSFGSAGGFWANKVARWDGAHWTKVSSGVNGAVNALTVFDDGAGPALYAGGSFSLAGGVSAKNVARWDGATWSALGGGTGGGVYSIQVHDDGTGPKLFVGGTFSGVVGGTPSGSTKYVAGWDGQAWSGLPGSPPAPIYALAEFDEGAGPALFAAGGGTVGGTWVGIQRWDGALWTSLGDGLSSGVRALTSFDDGSGLALFAGGELGLAGGLAVDHVARWDGTGWSPVGGGTNASVQCLATFDDGGGPALYAGGTFGIAGVVAAKRIARWDGASWSPLGQGVSALWSGGSVEALAIFDDGSGPALYAGGFFASAGGLSASNVARWDGAAWSPLGAGISSAGGVYALAVFDDGGGPALYAGGSFASASGVVTQHVARWDGSSWSAVGGGTNGQRVNALAVHDDGSGPALYAGGDFTEAGGVPASGVARWDGASWSAVGGGIAVPSPLTGVKALAVVDDGSGPALYAGGEFALAGGAPASGVARWDGSSWTALGGGVDGEARALMGFHDGTGPALFVGGDFQSAPDSGDSFLAKWGYAPISPLPGCFGNPATLSALAKSANVGQPFPLEFAAAAIPSGTAVLFGGHAVLDAAGCGILVPWLGEFLVGFSPFVIAQVPIAGGTASFPLVVPATPALVGVTVDLAAVSAGAGPAFALEMSTGLSVRISG